MKNGGHLGRAAASSKASSSSAAGPPDSPRVCVDLRRTGCPTDLATASQALTHRGYLARRGCDLSDHEPRWCSESCGKRVARGARRETHVHFAAVGAPDTVVTAWSCRSRRLSAQVVTRLGRRLAPECPSPRRTRTKRRRPADVAFLRTTLISVVVPVVRSQATRSFRWCVSRATMLVAPVSALGTRRCAGETGLMHPTLRRSAQGRSLEGLGRDWVR